MKIPVKIEKRSEFCVPVMRYWREMSLSFWWWYIQNDDDDDDEMVVGIEEEIHIDDG